MSTKQDDLGTTQRRLTEVYVVKDEMNPTVKHRPNPDADGPQPACEPGDADDRSWRYGDGARRCQRDGCFGDAAGKELTEMDCGQEVPADAELNHRLQCDDCEVSI